jgi:CspA family cold shock protein
MPTGTIKRLFKDRGFGFIRTPEGQEIFFHRTGLRSLRFDTLNEGDAVDFEVESSPKGPRAINIQAGTNPE